MSEPMNYDKMEVLISELLIDDSDFRAVVSEFVETLPRRIEELCSAHQSNDWSRLSDLAHRLKGAGGSYGYPMLSTLAAEMEQSFRRRDDAQFDEWIKNLDSLVRAASRGLESGEET